MKKLFTSKVFKTVLCGVIAFGLTFGTFVLAKANQGPVFNSNANDYPLIRLAKVPAGTSGYVTSLTAEKDDVVAVMLYYHNNVIDTTAKNTSLKVDLPSSQSTSHILSASLWADNASKVMGQATISTDNKTTLEYVAGSTLWYPDRNQHPNAAGVVSADGITAKGLNIHDICGCWEYAGFVSFKVKLNEVKIPPVKPEPKPEPQPEPEVKVIQIQKVEGVTSLPKTGSPLVTFALLSAVLAGLVVSGYFYITSRRELVSNK
jgi:hypothetical protein